MPSIFGDITVDIRADTSEGKLDWINQPPPEPSSIAKLEAEVDAERIKVDNLEVKQEALAETLKKMRLQTNTLAQLQKLTTEIANKQATLSVIEQQLRVLVEAANPITLQVSGNITVRVDGFKITSWGGVGGGTGIKTSNDSSLYLNNVDVFRCGLYGIQIGYNRPTTHQMYEVGEEGRRKGWEKDPWTRRAEGANAYLKNCTSNSNGKDGLYVALGSTVRLIGFEAINNNYMNYDINCQGQVMLFGKLTSQTLYMNFAKPGSRIERWEGRGGEVTNASYGIKAINVPVKDKPRYFERIEIVPEAYMDVLTNIRAINIFVGNSCIVEIIRKGKTGEFIGDKPEKTIIEVSATSENAVKRAVKKIKKIGRSKK